MKKRCSPSLIGCRCKCRSNHGAYFWPWGKPRSIQAGPIPDPDEEEEENPLIAVYQAELIVFQSNYDAAFVAYQTSVTNLTQSWDSYVAGLLTAQNNAYQALQDYDSETSSYVAGLNSSINQIQGLIDAEYNDGDTDYNAITSWQNDIQNIQNSISFYSQQRANDRTGLETTYSNASMAYSNANSSPEYNAYQNQLSGLSNMWASDSVALGALITEKQNQLNELLNA